MKTKLVSALVLIGIAAWVGFNSLGGIKHEENVQVDPLKLISTVEKEAHSLKKEDTEEISDPMGLYNSQASRKLTGGYRGKGDQDDDSQSEKKRYRGKGDQDDDSQSEKKRKGGAIVISDSIGQHGGKGRLNGKFEFSFPRVVVVVTQQYFVFRGCRDYKVPIIHRSKGIEFGPCESESSDCGYDPAYRIAQRFYRVNKFKRVDDGFACYSDDDDDGEESFRVHYKKESKKGKQVHGEFYEGEYEAEHPSYNVEVENNKFYFEGHKDKPVEFQYKDDDDSISFSKHFEKKKEVAVRDKDLSVVDLFLSSAKVNHKGANKGYEFKDKKGRSLVNCYPKKW